jgi:hypothetical protein
MSSPEPKPEAQLDDHPGAPRGIFECVRKAGARPSRLALTSALRGKTVPDMIASFSSLRDLGHSAIKGQTAKAPDLAVPAPILPRADKVME